MGWLGLFVKLVLMTMSEVFRERENTVPVMLIVTVVLSLSVSSESCQPRSHSGRTGQQPTTRPGLAGRHHWKGSQTETESSQETKHTKEGFPLSLSQLSPSQA